MLRLLISHGNNDIGDAIGAARQAPNGRTTLSRYVPSESAHVSVSSGLVLPVTVVAGRTWSTYLLPQFRYNLADRLSWKRFIQLPDHGTVSRFACSPVAGC